MSRRRPTPFDAHPHNGSSLGTDRAAALYLMLVPLIIVIIAFVTAVGTTLLGEMAEGTTRFYLAALSYSSLIASVMMLPAYLAGTAWFYWWTKDNDSKLLSGIWLCPLVSALFAWFPATLFPALGDSVGASIGSTNPLQVYFLMALATLVCGYVWSGLIRVALLFWRNV